MKSKKVYIRLLCSKREELKVVAMTLLANGWVICQGRMKDNGLFVLYGRKSEPDPLDTFFLEFGVPDSDEVEPDEDDAHESQEGEND